MTPNREKPGTFLDRAIGEIRDASATPSQVEQAASRVMLNLQAEYNKVVPHPAASGVDRIQSCDDFRALIPAYLSSSLTASRKLLFEDHIRECASCRKATDVARHGSSREIADRRLGDSARFRWKLWLVPVAAILVTAVALQTPQVHNWIWPVDVHAVVEAVDGGLFDVSGQNVNPVKAGQRVERGQPIRTGNASGAVLQLADGSRIEMASRSEISLERGRDGVKIQLARGNVIVTAAKQTNGRLYVETKDSLVSVVGTVFAVNTGVKGSRVSVIEGEVRVDHSGKSESLRPGQQAYTNPEMGAVPLVDEIAWSREADELRREIAAFGDDFGKRVEGTAMRYTSDLMPLVPADTLVFAALPNVSQPFKESYEVFRQRILENPTLASWWQRGDGSSGRVGIDEIARRLTEIGGFLGAEVILSFPKDMEGRSPLLLAETVRPADLVHALEDDIALLGAPLHLARNAQELAALSGNDLAIYVGDGLIVAADIPQVKTIAAVRQGKLVSGFSATPLYRRLQQAYGDGVGWLLAADLQQLIPVEIKSTPQVGFNNVQQLVLEQKTGIGRAASRASLGFSDARQGMAAWIAAPGPMGSLEFVSPDAYFASGSIVKDPALILDDVFSILRQNPAAWAHIQELQERQNIDFRRDIAEALGNEFLLAIDGPVLPQPSWKVILEVQNAPALENVIQWIVTNINREAAAAGMQGITLTSETVEGKTFHILSSPSLPMEIHYTFWVGYMVMAPGRGLLVDAIKNHDSGNTLGRSAMLRDQMPPDGRDHFSAIAYQNIQAMMKLGSTDVLKSVLGTSLNEVLSGSLPGVVCTYGEADRIVVAAKGTFGASLAGMVGLQGMLHAAGMH